MSRLYFAYGSNMHPAQMQARCPGAIVVGPAYADGWAFQLNDGANRWSHAATLRLHPGSRAHGIVWQVTEQHLIALDNFEQHKPSDPANTRYDRHDDFEVTHLATGEVLLCVTYIDRNTNPGSWDMCRQDRTYDGATYSYKDLVMGGQALGLPGEYIAWLEKWQDGFTE